MNATKHCEISVKRWGGQHDDYRAIHNFIDHTKSMCSDMRHRILHNQWAVNDIIVPIFGHSIENSDGRHVDVKDLCERDHLLVDYHNKFIPTLSDFVETIDEDALPADFKKLVEELHASITDDHPEVSRLLLSPLSNTGRFKSLIITHNSWFVNEVLPLMFATEQVSDNFALAPSILFNSMTPQLWMDNGISYPNSYKHLKEKLI